MKRLLQFKTLAIALCLGFYSNAQVIDGSFEAGIGGGAWTEVSPAFGTPICDAGCGDCGGPCVANTGSFYAWFGGAPGAVETGSLEQTLTIPAGTSASIDLWVKLPGTASGLATDRLEVSLDGTILSTLTALDSAAYNTYTLLSIDINSSADGGSHTLRIEGFQSSTVIFNVLVDDVSLSVDGVTVGLFEEITEPKFKVFPNPATEVVNLTFGEINGDALVSIISVDGTVVSKEVVSNVFNKNLAFSTANMESGVYIVEVKNEGTVTTKRIVVAK